MWRGLSAIASAVVLCGAVSAAQPHVAPRALQTWQTDSGLPQNSVHAVAQTTDGYLWVGTEGGLARFDGLQFTVFDTQNTPSLRSNNIRALLAGQDRDLWIGTADGLLHSVDGRFDALTTSAGLPSNNITGLFADSKGRVWAITPEGVARLDRDRFTLSRTRAGDAGSILSFVTDVAGQSWTGTVRGLLARDTPSVSIAGAVQALLSDHADRVWVGTTDGLYLVEGENKLRISGLPSEKITALLADRAGNVWVGTEAGAAEVENGDPALVQLLIAANGELVLSLLEDREGNLWMGSDAAGLSVLRRQKFRTYAHAEGLPNDLLRCVYADRKGQLWVGTNGHGLLRFGDPHREITTFQGLTSNVILSLAEDQNGHLLVGTPDGLNEVVGEQVVRTMSSGDGLPDDFIRSVYTEGRSIFVGTRRGLAEIVDGKVAATWSSAGLPSELVGSMQRGPGDCLFVSTREGLACLQSGTVAPGHRLLAGVATTALYREPSGPLWIGTASGGLARWDGHRLVRFPESLGLPKSIFGISADSHGQLWLTSPNGLLCVRRQELEAFARDAGSPVSVASYGTADGLSVNEFVGSGYPTVCRDKTGTLWFVTAKGLVSIDSQQAVPNPVPPSVVLESVTLEDRTVMHGQLGALGPGVAHLAFQYAGLSFISPQKVRYRYRLEGFDRGWVDAGTRRTAYYTNLAPRSYRFWVAARNNDGIWSAPVAIAGFKVKPFFRQTIWFYVLLAALALALGYLLYQWRLREVRRQCDAVLAERTRIAREIHDTLAQGFVAISVQLELAARLLSTSTESAREVLSETRRLAQDSLADARRSIWDLRSEAGSHDLPTRLAKTVRAAVGNSGLTVKLNTSGAYRSLPAKVEDELVRIGREAAVNAARHAEATSLEVALTYHANKAQMIITDNGRGFVVSPDPAGPNGHYGLRGMRERAEEIGASLHVSSFESQGTQVSVEVPLT